MKLLFLNTWGGKRQDIFTHYIQEQTQDTDIFCFQEATDQVKLLCQNILSDYTEVSIHKITSKGEPFFQTTYVSKKLSLLSFETLFQKNDACGLGLYTHIRYAHTDMHLCNVHGIPQPGDKRDTAGRVQQSAELIDFFRNKQGLRIIGGDFNLLPDTHSVRVFENNGYKNLIKEYAIDTTRNELSWKNYPNDKQYYADYVFVNQEVRVSSFSVPKNLVSDHLPLLMDIAL